jgi:cytochrome c-type biogenesis protein CcmE
VRVQVPPPALKKVIFFFASLFLVIAYILFTAMYNQSYYLEANQIVENPSRFEGKSVKVSGVVFGVEKWGRNYSFFLSKEGKGVFVKYSGAVPDAFGEGVPVVVEGTYKGDTIFAKTILTKCPSKYESAQK